MTAPFKVLAFGGGVQSSALLQLCIEGRFERPDAVIFSDTGSEMPETYAQVERAAAAAAAAGIAFEVVQSERGPLHSAYREREGLPVVGIRTCTSEWKRRPINRHVRGVLGLEKGERASAHAAEIWLGITTDERGRAHAGAKWMVSRYPLLELGLSRRDCEGINEAAGWGDVRKSGCFCCPYQSKKDWSSLRVTHPDLFNIAKEMERAALDRRGMGFFDKPSLTLDRFDFNTTLDDWAPKCEGPGGCFT